MDTTEQLDLSSDIKRRHHKIDEEKAASLAAAMRKDGWTERRLLAVECDGHYVAITGTHRIEAARRAGLTSVPALILDAQELTAAAGIFVECKGGDYFLENCDGDAMVSDGDYQALFADAGYREAASLMEAESQSTEGQDGVAVIPAFLKRHKNVVLCERLAAFYNDSEYEKHQHSYIEGTQYMQEPLFLDFERIKRLDNGEFADETIGETYLPFANLTADLESDPQGHDVYAHLAIDPTTTVIYLVEPSGEPELIAKDLDAILSRLQS